MDRELDAMGMLDLMVSPGFCVKDQKIIRCNAAAQSLLIREGADILPLLATGKAEYAAGEEFCGTKLPFEMFFSVEKGSAVFTFGEKELRAAEGEAVLMPCDTEYKIYTEDGATLGFTGFEARIFTVLRILSLFDYIGLI